MFSLLELYRHNPQHRNHLLPVYLSVLHNPAESRQLRIAAVLCVMNMQPTTVQLQKMAVSTWSVSNLQQEMSFYFIFPRLRSMKVVYQPHLDSATPTWSTSTSSARTSTTTPCSGSSRPRQPD